jgi:hypothetical protein
MATAIWEGGIDAYSVGGTVSGLSGNGLVLQNNGGDNLVIDSDGGFTFTTALTGGSTYEVTVMTQPSDPTQHCSVSKGSGTIAGADVSDVIVKCVSEDVIFRDGFE